MGTKHSLEIGEIKKYLIEDPSRKMILAILVGATTTGAVDKWIQRGKLPRQKRSTILGYIRNEGRRHGVSGPVYKR